MKFGDRISTITIKSVYIHTIVGEHFWARTLKDCDDGESQSVRKSLTTYKRNTRISSGSEGNVIGEQAGRVKAGTPSHLRGGQAQEPSLVVSIGIVWKMWWQVRWASPGF